MADNIVCEEDKPCSVAVSEIVRTMMRTQDELRREESERRRILNRIEGEIGA